MADANKGKRPQDGGERGPRKKGKYVSSSGSHSSNQAIPLGSVGVFITCDSIRERKAALQLIPLLEQYYDELAGKSAAADSKPAADGADIRSLIEAEVQESKSVDKFRFKFCDTGVKGCAFIRFPSDKDGPSPQAVTVKILRQVEASKELPTPLISRLLPVTHTCHANIDDIQEMAKVIVPLHFPEGEGIEGCSFSIEYEHRSCNQFDRMAVINAFAELAPKSLYKVDLSNPKRSILVQISRNVCAASVVEDYKALAKYNIRKLAEVDEEGDAQKDKKVGGGGKGAGKVESEEKGEGKKEEDDSKKDKSDGSNGVGAAPVAPEAKEDGKGEDRKEERDVANQAEEGKADGSN